MEIVLIDGIRRELEKTEFEVPADTQSETFGESITDENNEPLENRIDSEYAQPDQIAVIEEIQSNKSVHPLDMLENNNVEGKLNDQPDDDVIEIFDSD